MAAAAGAAPARASFALRQAQTELTISRLTEERSLQNRERDALKRDLEMLRKTGGRAIQVGFPFLYVCAVALVALAAGYIIHP
ncbi:vesicle-associated protein 2-2-like isoform X2 [Syzygium oleosum]|uniref:vesicle-associated protein 2-2-like isoform X2 n=1 Tax=Syzygium oleosum TaxID=219896 RepID=UPI0024BBE736|nr:vesicle-associated protein 2-2-like isoform X2 [Syzygium oleosum]